MYQGTKVTYVYQEFYINLLLSENLRKTGRARAKVRHNIFFYSKHGVIASYALPRQRSL